MSDDDLELELANSEVDAHIARMVQSGTAQLLPFPPVLVRVRAALARGAGTPEIARLIGTDPALTAMLLRVANTASRTQVLQPTVSLEVAMDRVGIAGVTRFCMTAPLATQAFHAGPLAAMRRQAWSDALASAFIAAGLAADHGIAKDEAYTAGLLHDFGRILALSCLDDAISSNPHLLIAQLDWASLVEEHHNDLGWLMAKHWNLPSPLPMIIHEHHNVPSTPLHELISICDAVLLLSSEGELTLEDLASVPGLESGEQARKLMSLLNLLPDVLASFGVSRHLAA